VVLNIRKRKSTGDGDLLARPVGTGAMRESFCGQTVEAVSRSVLILDMHVGRASLDAMLRRPLAAL